MINGRLNFDGFGKGLNSCRCDTALVGWQGLIAMLVTLLVGIHISATASTPVATGLLMAGILPGWYWFF